MTWYWSSIDLCFVVSDRKSRQLRLRLHRNSRWGWRKFSEIRKLLRIQNARRYKVNFKPGKSSFKTEILILRNENIFLSFLFQYIFGSYYYFFVSQLIHRVLNVIFLFFIKQLWIKFVSDGSVQKAGFAATFMKGLKNSIKLNKSN